MFIFSQISSGDGVFGTFRLLTVPLLAVQRILRCVQTSVTEIIQEIELEANQ